ncbi:ABC transporter permease [Streptococcus pneumoniae]|nr:ABC transporter permease [Streptococcus pneumoniae]
MESLIQTYLPNVYKMGWSGQAGWGTAIYLTLYMTVLSFIIGGFLGASGRSLSRLDSARWCLGE